MSNSASAFIGVHRRFPLFLRIGVRLSALIALTAWQIGAAVLTRNIQDFHRIQAQLPGLRVVTL